MRLEWFRSVREAFPLRVNNIQNHYEWGYAVFPKIYKGAIGGLMYEASVGGQTFQFTPAG